VTTRINKNGIIFLLQIEHLILVHLAEEIKEIICKVMVVGVESGKG